MRQARGSRLRDGGLAERQESEDTKRRSRRNDGGGAAGRNGTFEPKLIEKHQTRFEGFDAKILSMYALGMTVRDIQGHLHDMYGVDVSPTLISEVTDSIQEEVKTGQDRPLEALYPIVYLDALMVKMRHDGKVENRAVCTAIGINIEGQKSVLGLWASNNEGAKHWMSVLTNLKNRGMKDAFIICTDGLKGFPRRSKRSSPVRWCRPASSI
jgi:putative transposase